MRDIRRRIVSVKNTQQITKAMEMVSAAKLRRSQNQVTEGRPFANKLREVLGRLAEAQTSKENDTGPVHPLLEVREVSRVLYVMITADRGLAGGYNSNMIRFFSGILQREEKAGRALDIIVVGRKGKDFLTKSEIEPVDEHLYIGDEIEYVTAQSMAQGLMESFTGGKYDEIHFVYSQFVSAATQRPTDVQLLPLSDMVDVAESSEDQVDDYIYEPDPETVLNILLPRFVEMEVFRMMVEAKASEHGARMTAMRSASDNADEMIDQLTLTYNRARQAGITKEISEIVGGAEAIAAE